MSSVDGDILYLGLGRHCSDNAVNLEEKASLWLGRRSSGTALTFQVYGEGLKAKGIQRLLLNKASRIRKAVPVCSLLEKTDRNYTGTTSLVVFIVGHWSVF